MSRSWVDRVCWQLDHMKTPSQFYSDLNGPFGVYQNWWKSLTMSRMLQVVAQAQYALELDSPVPLGFFLNEEAPEHLVPEINGLSRDRPQNFLGTCKTYHSETFKTYTVNTRRDISACKHALTLFFIRKHKDSCFSTNDITSTAMNLIEAPWTQY